jgi:lipid II:glycine glycyltransferase (peptidoglycan interpeptide bridge formation enzyme)
MQLVEVTDQAAWDEYVGKHPYGHPLQLWGWGEAKRSNHWTPHRLALTDGTEWKAAAEVVLWPIPRLGRYIAYVPRGPVVEPEKSAAVLEAVAEWAKGQKALYLRVEPAWKKANFGAKWRRARHHLQLAATYTLDLSKSADELLEPMSRKHRQYIRKAERDGVTVERVADIDAMYDLYALTAQRAGFGIHSQEYYELLHQGLGEHSYLYVARYQNRPVAFLWLAAAGKTAYELYGGVSDTGQDVKANYFLKWKAIEEMQAGGFINYDFNGRLNEGVSRFKEGFGPDETDYVGTYDYVYNLVGYHLWEHLWPVAKPIGRRIVKAVRGRQ